jgi:hypothetical protein
MRKRRVRATCAYRSLGAGKEVLEHLDTEMVMRDQPFILEYKAAQKNHWSVQGKEFVDAIGMLPQWFSFPLSSAPDMPPIPFLDRTDFCFDNPDGGIMRLSVVQPTVGRTLWKIQVSHFAWLRSLRITFEPQN